jgi:hypothetical protein
MGFPFVDKIILSVTYDIPGRGFGGFLKLPRKLILTFAWKSASPISGVLSNQNGGELSLMSWISSWLCFSKNKIATSWVVIKTKMPSPIKSKTVIKSI